MKIYTYITVDLSHHYSSDHHDCMFLLPILIINSLNFFAISFELLNYFIPFKIAHCNYEYLKKLNEKHDFYYILVTSKFLRSKIKTDKLLIACNKGNETFSYSANAFKLIVFFKLNG